jgi:hypothetical protein
MRLASRFFQSSYDVFVSYKSHDVHLARHIAEQLIASGKRVWFAEYEILLRHYERFEASIDAGIGRCKYGLAFTNDRYAGSTHCQREMTQLLDRCGPEKVFEVRVPPQEEPRRLFPALIRSPSYDGRSVNGILEFLTQKTGWSLDLVPLDGNSEQPRHVQAVCMDRQYSLDTTGWELLGPGEQHVRTRSFVRWDLPRGQVEVFVRSGSLPMSVEGPSLRYCDDGAPPVFMNLHAGPEMSYRRRPSEPNPDDRGVYRQLMEYLPTHLRRLWFSKLRGLHLVFHGGFSQIAMTYRWGGYWTRKYSVIVPHPTAPLDTEFVFTFGFKGPFREFCRRAYLMDRLVGSLEWT